MQLFMICIILAGILGGGYFVSVSALLNIGLIGFFLYKMWKFQKIEISWDFNLLTFAILVFFYLISGMWAVDSGMALMGVVKFFPLLLFYILISGKEQEREKIIEQIPLMGCLMTLFSAIMMQFSVFESWVSVAGRLSGFFQYPNTYAMFMLICMIIAAWKIEKNKIDWLDILYGIGAICGIIMSGSRTVFVLMLVSITWILIARIQNKKHLLLVLASIGVVALIFVFTVGGSTVIGRLGKNFLGASTFLGRILYVLDALPVILKHPFGLGFYGYYFTQQSFQTGVYSVVNTHNELVQILLDVGWVPAILVCIMIVRSIIAAKNNKRNQMILIMMTLHSLFDYDFQFLVMGFVLILFLDIPHVKTSKVPIFSRIVLSGASIAMLIVSVLCGISEVCYTAGKNKEALQIYGGNTLAEIKLLTEADNAKDMQKIATSILSNNSSVSVAYSAMAECAFAEGDVKSYIDFKEKAIALAPYQYDEYISYLDVLAYCTGEYQKSGNEQDAKFCVEKAEEIPKKLEEVKEKTSTLGWKIADSPEVTLSHEKLELIEQMRRSLDE